jgi:protein-S-isoprenylcysteine O-methyltransferase Ste14
MQPWPLRIGKFMFKFRSFTPLPLIVLTFVLFRPLSPSLLWTVIGLAVSFLGEGIRMFCVGYAGSGTSGRENFLKAESLNSTGLYSLVRNPLYWGNGLIFAGLLTIYAQPLALILFAVFLFLQYYFIVLAEESFLRERYDPAFAEYCRRVNRWLPRFKNYAHPSLPFDRKKVFFKENDSCFNLLFTAMLILAWKEKVFAGRILHWPFFAGAATGLILFYITVKILKKRIKPPLKNS